MTKISILSLHLGYGGIEKSIIALANLLCDKYDVEIACSYKLYDKPAFFIDKRVNVNYLTDKVSPNRDEFHDAVHNRKISKMISEGIKGVKILNLRKKTMINYIKNCGSDVIISTRDIFDEWLGQYGRKGVVKVGWEHNHYHGDMAYARKVASLASKLDYFVLVSNELREFYSVKLRGSKCKCVYIPNIIDKLPKYTSKLTKKRLVSVGRLSPEKGFMDLLKVFKLVSKEYPDWTLDIIGDGPERKELSDYIADNNLGSKVKLHGFRNKDYIDEVLHNSSLYLMTSFTESFGIVLIEAMSHGVPCIAFDSAEGARELISSGKNGYLIYNRNLEAYSKKVCDLIEDKETRIKIGKKCYETAKSYTGEVVIDSWIKIIEKK